MGTDDQGNIIFMQSIARAHPKTLVKAGPVSMFYRISITQTEMCFKLIRQLEQKHSKKLGLKIIMGRCRIFSGHPNIQISMDSLPI